MLTHASISKSNSASSSNAKQDVVYTADRESYEPIRRLKREDVSKIKHLYDETRIDEHSEAGKEAIVQKHNEYRSSTTPVASNMEYMVSDFVCQSCVMFQPLLKVVIMITFGYIDRNGVFGIR